MYSATATCPGWKIQRVDAAFRALCDTRRASRHQVPQVRLVSDRPDSKLPNGKTAHLEVFLNDQQDTRFWVVIVDSFESRPKRRSLRKAVRDLCGDLSAKAGSIVTFVMYGKERLHTLLRKAAQCIRIAVNTRQRTSAYERAKKRRHEQRERLMSMPRFECRQSMRCAA